ncbi:hypothetical protein N7456_006429 [Penicillium angulare]|uniref:YjgF/Yer057p/UK114 family n=1 Tax=Penicillium angulare TaxID=116970 RepID=A0A9W9FHN6_9EURO|nr:hypothetical protein N7456_006429 [Penicillium angulare]
MESPALDNQSNIPIAQPLASYSTARAVPITSGVQLLYISGTTARQPDGRIPPFDTNCDGSLSAAFIQTGIILEKIESTIRQFSSGTYGLEALVDLTIFVLNLDRDYVEVNKAYNQVIAEAFHDKGCPLPARTCVQVSAMPPDERSLVEIKGLARLGQI